MTIYNLYGSKEKKYNLRICGKKKRLKSVESVKSVAKK